MANNLKKNLFALRRVGVRSALIAVVMIAILSGAALALVQITRQVPATVDVHVMTSDGIEIYLDSDLMQLAQSLEFGRVDVDPFGTQVSEVSIPVWAKNVSFSNVRLTLDDDFPDADVVFVGQEQEPVLAPGQVLPGALALDFSEPNDGVSQFTVIFQVEGPVPAPTSTPGPAISIAIRMAVPEVSAPFGDFEVQSYGAQPDSSNMGFFDPLLIHDGVDPMAPFAAEAWSINPAGNEMTLTIRDDLKVHTPDVFAGNDFGFITAQDVAWNMNRQNSIVNPNLGFAIGAQLGATFGVCNAFGDTTVKCPFVSSIFWGVPITEFDINDTTVRLDSKTAYDTMGASAMQFVPVGSGPMVFDSVQNNDRLKVVSMPGEHWASTAGVWDETPNIGSFTVIQVPDTQSRLAMMQVDQADLGEIDFGRIRELPGLGLEFMQTMTDVDTMTLGVIWPGNLWTDLNAKTNDDLEPWLSPVYDVDYPWIGNPWCDLGKPCRYTDTDNPPGMTDMEQARLVRWALSYSIDRQDIIDRLQGGFGTPIYLELMGEQFPGWDPSRTISKSEMDASIANYGGSSWPEYQVDSPLPNEDWPWEVPTDTSKAEMLLDLAGYPGTATSTRFTINLNKYRCETGPVCLEQADAVAAGWEAIGVRTTLLTEEYGSVVVPRMRDRTQPWPVVKNCSVETANYPLDWPPPPSDSTFSRPAWGCAFESKFLDYMYMNINGERDKTTREDLHLDMVDYYYYWQLYSGISNSPRGVAAHPDRIISWQSRSTAGGFWGRPQHIVPR